MTAQSSAPISPRAAAQAWIADTLRTYLHPQIGSEERIQFLAAGIEEDCHQRNISIESALTMAVELCEEQNEEAGLSHAAQN